ncbi:SAF domain-containing protein [Moorella naiadis]|uniref:SAF domain-containing protein n=1 Tax=Moorella naiadis (nom. illeg.) TaxID=3093670 RepID=UPI003D9C9819
MVAIIVSLTVALFSAKQLKAYVNAHQETVRVVVASRDIPPYTVLSQEDLSWRAVIKGGEEPGTIKDPAEAVGKMTLSLVPKDQQIARAYLVDAKLAGDREVISLNVDVTRCVGGSLKSGDLVDVWWVVPELANSPGGGRYLAATDAIVLDIRDSNGKSTVQQAGGFLNVGNAQAAPPAVAVLAVKPDDVPNVVAGASPKSQNIVLVKKYVPGNKQNVQQQAPEISGTNGGVVNGGSVPQKQ